MAAQPTGFLSGGYLPAGQTYHEALGKLSYQYPASLNVPVHGRRVAGEPVGDYNEWYVPPGEHTAALYVISPYAPGEGMGQVQDSGAPKPVQIVATGVVPEPATMAGVFMGVVSLVGYLRGRSKH